ncbi:MAG: photosystem II reaction center protein PsbM [Synechococcaceae bacterium WB6_3B_236]|nr:photosystem II reaction center protein PsbM [Synechococcaceae bacterium WB6_3B_236]
METNDLGFVASLLFVLVPAELSGFSENSRLPHQQHRCGSMHPHIVTNGASQKFV